MRTLCCLLGLLVLGCETRARPAPAAGPPAHAQAGDGGAANGASKDHAGGAGPALEARTRVLVDELPRGDLRTRKTGSDWPSFLGPTGDSKSSERGIIVPWPAAGLRIVWQQPLGTGYGAPTISRGRLYQFARFGDRARLTCMRSESGEQLWQFDYPTDYEDFFGYNNGPRCCPVVDEDRVYVHGAQGMLYCVNAIDGQLIWHVDTHERFGVVPNFFGVGSTPIVEGDLLIVMVGGSPEADRDLAPGDLGSVHGNGTGVVALDKRTGEVKYKLSDELASYSSPVTATIGDRRWCFVFARGGLLGFEPASGKLDFHFPWRARILESVNASDPVVVGDRVFVSETYGPGSALLKVRPGGYEVVWDDSQKGRRKSMQTHWNTCVHHEGYLYGSSGRHTNSAELRCIRLEDGKVMWSEPGLTRSSLLYVDGHLVCLTEFGDLLLLKANPEKFDVVSQVTMTENRAGPFRPGFGPRPLLDYPAWAAPVLSHGLLYVRGADRLLCLELIPPAKDD